MSADDSTTPRTPADRLARKRETTRLWALANRDRRREHERLYKAKNRALLAARARAYRLAHPEREVATRTKHRVKNRAKFRARYRQYRAEAIRAYGGCCRCCGEANLCFLTIDHVRNDGALHRRCKGKAGEYHGNGYKIYAWLRTRGYPQDGRFQVLCYNCNCCKTHDPIGHRKAHPNARFIDGLGGLDDEASCEGS
jgi:hypothetical protein